MGYLFTVQFGFCFGRDRLWTRNLETIFRSVWKYFLIGTCIVWRQVYYLLFFMFYLVIYLYCFVFFLLFFFLLLYGVSFCQRCFHVYFSFCESIYLSTYLFGWGRRGGVYFWYSCMLMACNYINNEILCAFIGLLSVGECIFSKKYGQPLFLLEMNFTTDITYFSNSFHHAFMLQ